MLYILSDQRIKELIWKDDKHGPSPQTSTCIKAALKIGRAVFVKFTFQYQGGWDTWMRDGENGYL